MPGGNALSVLSRHSISLLSGFLRCLGYGSNLSARFISNQTLVVRLSQREKKLNEGEQSDTRIKCRTDPIIRKMDWCLEQARPSLTILKRSVDETMLVRVGLHGIQSGTVRRRTLGQSTESRGRMYPQIRKPTNDVGGRGLAPGDDRRSNGRYS